MVGDELRRARKNAGITQEQLAFDAEVDRSYISLLENDHASPTLDAFFRICKALKVRASEVIARIEAAESKGKKK